MKINKNELLKVLSAVRPGIAKKDIVEQATHFIFTGNEVITYNDRICISHPFKTDFQCSVKGEEFYKLISSITDDDIEIKVDDKQITVKADKVRSGLSTLVESGVVELIDLLGIDKQEWKKLPKGFNQGIFLCMFSASKDISQTYLSCVATRGNALFSSDNFRVSLYELEDELPEFLIPAISVIELSKFDVEKYSLADSWIHFKTKENVIFSSRIVVAEYPDISGFFEIEKGTKINFPKELKSVVEAVSIMAEGDLDLNKKIDIKITKGKMTCRGEKDRGWVERDCDIDYKGKEIEFSINPIFFGQILDKATTMVLSEDRALFESDFFKHIMSLPI